MSDSAVMPALAALKEAGIVLKRSEAEIIADLQAFGTLLEKWQKAQNLVSRETLPAFWSRHVADSLQLLSHLPDRCLHIVDLGSGGGLPAIPLAIALKGPEVRLSLVEANSRKCAFLRTVTRELDLAVHVFNKRIDANVSRETGPADVVTARALAALPELLGLVVHFWRDGTVALLHKGREHVEEIAQAGAVWDFDVVTSPSTVDRTGAVLKISNLRRKTG